MSWHVYPQDEPFARQAELLREAESARRARLARDGSTGKNGTNTRTRIRWAIAEILHPVS